MNIDEVFSGFERQAYLDLKLNFKKFYSDGALAPKEAALSTLSCAESVGCKQLKDFAVAELKKLEVSEEEISEAREIAAVMGVANMYYRFRHFMHDKPAYQKPAGFRMSLLSQAKMGKLAVEMTSLAVSVLNGCEMCVQGHEKAVIEHGGTEEQVHDLARLAATIFGLQKAFES